MIKNSQPFGKKCQKTAGGIFVTQSVYGLLISSNSVPYCFAVFVMFYLPKITSGFVIFPEGSKEIKRLGVCFNDRGNMS